MKNTQKKSAQYWEAYKTRVQELEAEGLCTSDAQSVADVEFDESLKNVDEHTPGPWVVDFCNGKPYVVNGNFCAARVHGTEKTLLANARLIAAAPERCSKPAWWHWLPSNPNTRSNMETQRSGAPGARLKVPSKKQPLISNQPTNQKNEKIHYIRVPFSDGGKHDRGRRNFCRSHGAKRVWEVCILPDL